MHRISLPAMLAAAFGLLPCAAYATPITPGVSSQGFVGFYDSGTSSLVSTACSTFSGAGAALGCSGSTTTPTTGATLNYLTFASAGYGVLKAAGQSSITGASGTPNGTDYSSAYGQASFQDSWTITGGSGTGTLALQFDLDGSYNYCGIGSGLTLGFSLVNFSNSSFANGTPSLSGCSGSIATTTTLTTSFTFGTPLDFLVNLQAGSNLFDLGSNISSNLDFSNTAKMSAIVVKNSGGNVVPFNLSTGSGAPLFSLLAPGAPSPVPEPSSLSLLAVGLAGLAAMRRRKRQGSGH